MVTPSVRFDFDFVPLCLGTPENAGVTQHLRPLLGPNLVLLRKPGQSLNPRFDTRSIMVTPSVRFDF